MSIDPTLVMTKIRYHYYKLKCPTSIEDFPCEYRAKPSCGTKAFRVGFPLQMNQLLLLCLLLATAYAATIDNDSFKPIIEKVNSLKTTWKADPNFPSDVTISSIKRLLGARKSANKLPLKQDNDISATAIPEEFDARQQWPECPTISQIADQSNCGSCWAVAAATAFSDRLCIATKGKFTTPLSAAELLSCCTDCGDGCDGGYTDLAWFYFRQYGIATGGAYNSSIGCQPYTLPPCEHGTEGSLPQCSSLPDYDTPTCQKTCTNGLYQLPFKQDHHRAKAAYSLDNEKYIQKDIMAHGPVAAVYDVYKDFPTYKSGVYKKVSGQKLGYNAVRIIGWGTENGTPYWLIANSWNTHWGDGGVFKILRGTNECGIEAEVSAGIPHVEATE